MEYDVIGDIHGYAGVLERLLAELGYEPRAAGWKPPVGRRAVFLGDLIDRGDEQLKVLDTVRRMVDNDDALCILGNHELNAIGWATPSEARPGEFLRPHTENKRRQHAAFLAQIGEGSALHREWIDWFRTLPVALDLGGLRAVHAWWNPGHVERVMAAGDRRLEGEWLQELFRKGGDDWRAFDELTKGHELALPDGATFEDEDGHARTEIRTQWWRSDARTYRDIAQIEEDQRERIPELPLPDHYAPTPVSGSPVFVGHYWLKGPVARRDPKLACLDFSVARGGPLVAYRWSGEDEIDDDNFVEVR
jgi:hypothetical protein